MSTPLENRQRDGVSSLIEFARQTCRIVGAFGFIIEAKYPPDSPVGLLYIAVKNVCNLLPAAEADFYSPQSDNSGVISDPNDIPGINPGAPAPPEPEEP